MSTPFLYGFAAAVVSRLLDGDRVEIAPGGQERVVRCVADELGAAREGASLISSLSASLLACPEVVELYADDDELKELVSDLGMAN